MTMGVAEIAVAIAIGGFLMTLIINVVLIAIGWGKFASTMASLTKAVDKLDTLITEIFKGQNAQDSRITVLETLSQLKTRTHANPK